MNNNTKIIIWVIVIVVILGGIWFYYYYNKNNTNNNNSSQIVEPIDDNSTTSSYVKELVSFLPLDLTGEVTYSGSLEHIHIINFDKATRKTNSVEYKGNIEVGEGVTKEDLNFEERYVVEEDILKLIRLNKNRLFFQSLAMEQYILKMPIELDNAWKQSIEVDGKKYDADYNITSVDTSNNNKQMVTVEMTINGIDGYVNNTYTERLVITQGKGVTSFENTILTGGQGEDKVPLDFGYNLSTKDM